MAIHHATAKRAEKHGIILTEVESENGTVYQAHWPKMNQRLSHVTAKTVLDAMVQVQTLRAEYPAITIDMVDGQFGYVGTDADGEAHTLHVTDEVADLADILDMAIGEGINPEYGYHEEVAAGAVVKDTYKKIYADAGHPDDCGDNFAAYCRGMSLDDFIKLCKENGVVMTTKMQDAMDGGVRGWQGRVRMSMGNSLRAKVRKDGKLTHNGKDVKMAV